MVADAAALSFAAALLQSPNNERSFSVATDDTWSPTLIAGYYYRDTGEYEALTVCGAMR
jgi:hypothetical protein